MTPLLEDWASTASFKPVRISKSLQKPGDFEQTHGTDKKILAF
jgi:hypothetical protein